MNRLSVAVALAVTLSVTACGKGPEKRAVEVCQKAIADKLAGKTFDVDSKDMMAKAKSEPNGAMTLSSVVVFDKGLPGESKQTVECKVQFDPKNAAADPSIVGMSFVW
jgi:hypothetical protein